MKKKIICSFLIVKAIISFSSEVAFTCNTDKHTIVIEKLDAVNFRYRSWNKPKTMQEKPDMDLKSNDASVVGTGPCRHNEYNFKTGKVVFSIDDDLQCVEGKPPQNAIGNLNVYINDELKSHYFCIKNQK